MTAAPGRPAPDDVLGVPVRPVRIVLAAPLRLQQRSRQRVRLQAGVPKPRPVAVAPQAKYRKQPHAKYQAVAGTDALGQYLTRRANQWHSFIIAQSVKRPWPGHSALFGAILGENSYPQLKLQWLGGFQVGCALDFRFGFTGSLP